MALILDCVKAGRTDGFTASDYFQYEIPIQKEGKLTSQFVKAHQDHDYNEVTIRYYNPDKNQFTTSTFVIANEDMKRLDKALEANQRVANTFTKGSKQKVEIIDIIPSSLFLLDIRNKSRQLKDLTKSTPEKSGDVGQGSVIARPKAMTTTTETSDVNTIVNTIDPVKAWNHLFDRTFTLSFTIKQGSLKLERFVGYGPTPALNLDQYRKVAGKLDKKYIPTFAATAPEGTPGRKEVVFLFTQSQKEYLETMTQNIFDSTFKPEKVKATPIFKKHNIIGDKNQREEYIALGTLRLY